MCSNMLYSIRYLSTCRWVGKDPKPPNPFWLPPVRFGIKMSILLKVQPLEMLKSHQNSLSQVGIWWNLNISSKWSLRKIEIWLTNLNFFLFGVKLRNAHPQRTQRDQKFVTWSTSQCSNFYPLLKKIIKQKSNSNQKLDQKLHFQNCIFQDQKILKNVT